MYKYFKVKTLKGKLARSRHDLVAALVVTAVAIPQSLGFAVIVGLPPITGLYTALLAPIVFGLLSSTRRLVVGADSATAALIASGAMLVAQAGTAGYVGAVAMLTLLVAGILLLMALLRLGLLADLISRPVLVGFLAGVGIQLMVMNLPGLFGLPVGKNVWQDLELIVRNFSSIDGLTATISLLVVGVMLIMRKSRWPGELIGLVFAGLFVVVFQAGAHGVQLVGALPAGLPEITAIPFSLATITALLPAAVAIALVVLAQSALLIRTTADEHDEPVKLNRDLFALGIGNAVSAFTQGFSVNGSAIRTLAAENAGSRTAMVNVFTGVFVGLLLLFGTQLFAYIPQAALSSIVFLLGYRLIRIAELKRIWQAHRIEFLVAMIALLGTVFFGVLLGVCVAVAVSLTERLIRQYHPKDSILLRDGELSEWAIERIGQHHNVPNELLVYSFSGSLFFENINYFTSRISQSITLANHPVYSVIVDAGAIDSIDYTAVGVLESFCRHLGADGISLGFAHVSPGLREQFNTYGLTTLIGPENIFVTLTAAFTAHSQVKKKVIERVKDLALERDSYVVVGGSVLDVLGLRNSSEVDLVVSQDLYDAYRSKKDWHEFTQANTKKVLSKDGTHLMTTWVGNSLKSLQQDATKVNGIHVISLKRLIDGKQQLGRRKDFADIKLLRRYVREHKS